MPRSTREVSVENELIPESGREVQPLPDPAPVIATAPPPAAATAPVPAAPEAPLYRDRGTGLVLFGVVQIIMGLFALLMVPLIMLTAFMSRLAPGGSMRPGQYVSTVATYALLSAALITLGVGSVQMRRWARALTLVVSLVRNDHGSAHYGSAHRRAPGGHTRHHEGTAECGWGAAGQYTGGNHGGDDYRHHCFLRFFLWSSPSPLLFSTAEAMWS